MPASEPIQVDASPPSEMEVIKEVGFLKKNKTSGPNGMSLSLFKDAGDVLKSQLTQFLGSI